MKYLFKTFLLGIVSGIVLTAIAVGIGLLGGQSLIMDGNFFTSVQYYLLYGLILTWTNSAFLRYVNNSRLFLKYGKYRSVLAALGNIVLSMTVIFLIRMGVEIGMYNENWQQFMAGEVKVYYLLVLLGISLLSVLYHAISFYKHWQEGKVKEQKIIAGAASAKFDALKNQLDPHFLFNSLNVLSSLIDEDPRQAQKFTTSLSKVYRYVLEQKNKDLVSIDEELEFARTYVQLLKMRFEDSIVFDIPMTSKHPEARIVPLSLQLLLENAVKHNIVTSAKPLRITVSEGEGRLIVSNNLQEKEVLKKGSGVGLRNIQQRYHILSDKTVDIQKTKEAFSVSLPILTKKISIMETQQTYIQDKRYLKAKERVEAIKGFYGNLTAYCIVIPILAWLNFKTTDFVWVIFPSLGWGFGLLMHGMEAYGYNPLWGKRWEEKKIRELMENDDF